MYDEDDGSVSTTFSFPISNIAPEIVVPNTFMVMAGREGTDPLVLHAEAKDPIHAIEDVHFLWYFGENVDSSLNTFLDRIRNGFEIPFYFIIFLLVLIINGPGRLSLDQLISKRLKK